MSPRIKRATHTQTHDTWIAFHAHGGDISRHNDAMVITAHCICGWVGTSRDTSADANNDAIKHVRECGGEA